ncbi:hypothetical protein ACFY2W_36140 [Streptomyces sp. NPDC001262]|uniref:hypothetical protein n=1 Tax=Streptomyces sp. NPDC001262 TaxID=3364552 RepID=UPI00369E876C
MASVSIVILLILLCAACIKFGTMRLWHLLVAGVLGFYLHESTIGPSIAHGLTHFFSWVGTLKF